MYNPMYIPEKIQKVSRGSLRLAPITLSLYISTMRPLHRFSCHGISLELTEVILTFTEMR